LDKEARYIHYEGRNKEADLPSQDHSQGRDVYGYASNPDRLIDDRFACAWTLRTGLYPANTDERNLFPDSFASLQARFPYLEIGEVVADAALGFQCCLDPIWEAGALRMVDLRAAEGDDDPPVQLRRGYDEKGHPLCLHGYEMSPNGHDYDRRRTKWCCEPVLAREGLPEGPQASSPGLPLPDSRAQAWPGGQRGPHFARWLGAAGAGSALWLSVLEETVWSAQPF
jgi:hypothetical protein